MAFSQVANIAPQYNDNPGYFLKFYIPTTTTPIVMATNADGTTTLAKAELDLQGFITTDGTAKFIPFVSQSYDAFLFPTALEANNNNTTNAVRIAENITVAGVGGGGGGGLTIESFGGGVTKTAEENATAWLLATSTTNGEVIIYGSTDESPKIYNQNPTVVTEDSVSLKVIAETTILGAGDANDYFFKLNVLSATVIGDGTIDGNDLHSRGVGIINDTDNDGGIATLGHGLKIINCRQFDSTTNPISPQTITSAGIHIRGHFELAVVSNAIVERIWSDAPAVDSGGSGQGAARGILIDYSRESGRVAVVGTVEKSKVTNLFPANDADGVFMQQAPWIFDRLSSLHVNNCVFTDCEKRAVKSQIGINKINNNHIIRTRKVTLDAIGAAETFGTDIDVQYSGGEVDGNTFVYKSGYFAPRSTYGIAAQGAFADPDTTLLSPLWDVADTANHITDTSITIEDDLTGDLYRLFTATSRYSASLDKLKPLDSVTIDGVVCNKAFDTLGLLFAPGTVGTSQNTFNGVTVKNITCESITQEYLISATESSTEPALADSYGVDLTIDNIKTTDEFKFHSTFTESVVDNGDNIVVTLGAVNDGTPVVGHTTHKIEGRVLNGDTLSFDILNTQNDLVKVTVTYARTSSGSTQVRQKQVFQFIDSSGSGRRQLSDVTEYTDEQAGIWAISGDWNRDNSDGFHVTRLTKAAGVNTDAFATSRGWFSIVVESQSAVFVYASTDAEGATPTVFELKDSTISGSDYYPVFDNENMRLIPSALGLVQVGQTEIRKYLFTATTSADLPQTAQLRVGDKVMFSVVHGFTGTVNVDDAGSETIKSTSTGGAQFVDTSFDIDNAAAWWEFTYQGSGVWGARF